jgi:hypothetical protein
MKVLFYSIKINFNFPLKPIKVQRIGISFSSFIYLHCRKIHNLFVRALETGRKVHERKLSSLIKKMKESCKLDINQSVPENILSLPEVKRKQCGRENLWRFYELSLLKTALVPKHFY